ncbi:MAG: maleylacetoacetate isomerase [Rhodospirillaceae bacterium]
MGQQPIRLYSRYRNSAGQRARIALGLKGVDYEYVPMGDWHAPEYTRLNPQGLLPALEVDGRVFGQSTAIIEWLEQTVPEPSLLPDDPLDGIAARGFAQYIACEIHPIHNHRVRDHLMDVEGWSEEKTMVWYEHWVTSGLAMLETMLQRRPSATQFCYGDRPTLADIYLIPMLYNARVYGFDLARFPLILGIDAASAGIPAFQAARPENQPDFPG